jgi:imidazolonepropionase-like amidohydrolase
VLASDQIRPGGDQIESARSSGLTAALTAPRDGIFVGQSALVNLSGDTPQQMIVKSPVALHIGFTPLRTGGYPNSLMGVFASLRQMLLDAQRYREASIIYDKNPRGLRRPEPDKSLQALQPVLDGEEPVVMFANTEREIVRALDLAEEFKLHVVIAGGEESWKVADRLRKQSVPVILSLNFPKRTTAQMPEADPESMRVLRGRVDAPKTPGKLAAAQVKFAFESGAMTSMEDLLPNLAKAVNNGLSRDEALRAMTINPAQILGVADRLGTIEPGKIANLTITRGDLFDQKPNIAYVFIDGRPVDLKPATAAPAPAAATPASVSGIWNLSVNLGEGDVAVTLNLQQQGESLQGSIEGALGANQIANASIGSNGEISFTVPVTLSGQSKQTTEASFNGTVTGNQLRGTVQIVGRAPGTFSGSKPR